MNIETRSLVISIVHLRRGMGAIGAMLPLLLPLLWGAQESLSAYYYTGGRDVFVSALVSIGLLLLCHRGYDSRERAASVVGGLAIIVVALAGVDGPFRALHYAAAVAFFAAAVFLCVSFAQGTRYGRVFVALAVSMVVSLLSALVGVPLLVAEGGAVIAFGAAWLLKGRTIEAILGRE